MEIVKLGAPNLTQNQRRVLTPLYKDFELIRAEGHRLGDIFKCVLKSTKEVVAIKILTIPQDKKNDGVPSSILNHVSILKMLKHPNIVRLHTVMTNTDDEDNVYLVFEYLHNSLQRSFPYLFASFNENRIKFILRGALSGLAYCHHQKIIHRDLKPHNILVSFQKLDLKAVKLSDFGVATSIDPPLSPYSTNMGLPCYKAPELLLGSTYYSTAVDIWSMGCIFAEMSKLRRLFIGKDEPRILAEIFCLLGTPTEKTWPGVSSICNFIDAFNPPIEPKDLAAVFPMLEPDGLDLLSKMLCLCPSSRISADEALNHPYLQADNP